MTIFGVAPDVKKRLWDGEFWTNGYFATTVAPAWEREGIGDCSGPRLPEVPRGQPIALFFAIDTVEKVGLEQAPSSNRIERTVS